MLQKYYSTENMNQTQAEGDGADVPPLGQLGAELLYYIIIHITFDLC